MVKSAPQRWDLAIIGGGPAGAAAAITAARAGASVVVFEKGPEGRDKVCGDGLTPRAVAALDALQIPLAAQHRIDGLRMIANSTVRELSWPGIAPFGPHGAVWPRKSLDHALITAAIEAGATVRFGEEALPELDGQAVVGVRTDEGRHDASMVVLAAGAPGAAARILGADRDPHEPFGLAIRSYVESPRHTDRHLEACLTITDARGVPVPGYGWMFPAGDGTVNIGVGALSTMKGFRKLNLNQLMDSYRDLVAEPWSIGPYLSKPRAWRLPMSAVRRHGPGWVAVGDAAGLINPMNGEGIDYALESGILAAENFLADPITAPGEYHRQVAARFDGFLRTGRRFSFLIGHPWILRNGLRVAVGTDAVAAITLQVMGNLVDGSTPGAGGKALRAADWVLARADPILRATSERGGPKAAGQQSPSASG
jgi:geranylgeranyl reductase family protein